MVNIEQKIGEFLEKYHLKNFRQPILVAFSGGYDSMCLLDILVKNGFRPIAIHLNHKWRGVESDIEENRCKDFCNSIGVKIYCEDIDKSVPKTETAARNARYAFYKRCAETFNSKVVFTAHNANDNAETVLYRIIKGTAVDGLMGITPVRDIFYRPLIEVFRKDIVEYCKTHNLIPNNDSSNKNIKYSRNFIRHKILPYLEKINPDVVCAINSLSQIAKEDCELLSNLSYELDTSTDNFISAPYPLQKRFIKNKLMEYGLDYDRLKIELIHDFIVKNASSKSGKTMSLSSKLELFVNVGTIKVISSVNIKNNEQIIVNKEGFYEFGNMIFSITPCKVIPEKFQSDKNCIAYVSLDNIDFILRTRREGDVFSPLGLQGHQKLKKFLNEKKIPNYKKDNLILLCKGNEVLWVPGYGLSDKLKIKDKITHILKIYERVNNE